MTISIIFANANNGKFRINLIYKFLTATRPRTMMTNF